MYYFCGSKYDAQTRKKSLNNIDYISSEYLFAIINLIRFYVLKALKPVHYLWWFYLVYITRGQGLHAIWDEEVSLHKCVRDTYRGEDNIGGIS